MNRVHTVLNVVLLGILGLLPSTNAMTGFDFENFRRLFAQSISTVMNDRADHASRCEALKNAQDILTTLQGAAQKSPRLSFFEGFSFGALCIDSATNDRLRASIAAMMDATRAYYDHELAPTQQARDNDVLAAALVSAYEHLARVEGERDAHARELEDIARLLRGR